MFKGSFVSIEGIKLHYRVTGNGPDLLLVHGLGAHIYCWRKLTPMLSSFFKVWEVDLKGFGLSGKPLRSSYSLKTQSKLLAHFAQKMGISKLHVLGNSMGGTIALRMALDWPKLIERVILINFSHNKRALGPKENAKETIKKAAHSILGVVWPPKQDEATAQYMSLIYGRNYHPSKDDIRAYSDPYKKGGRSYFAFLASLHGLVRSQISEHLKEVKKPTLILWGQEDKLLPVHYGDMLHKEIPGSLYFVHPTAGHHIQEEDPQWVANHAIKFLNH